MFLASYLIFSYVEVYYRNSVYRNSNFVFQNSDLRLHNCRHLSGITKFKVEFQNSDTKSYVMISNVTYFQQNKIFYEFTLILIARKKGYISTLV